MVFTAGLLAPHRVAKPLETCIRQHFLSSSDLSLVGRGWARRESNLLDMEILLL